MRKTECLSIILFFLALGIGIAQSASPGNDSLKRKRAPRHPNWVHDPVMIKEGDTYYVFGTGISVKTSRDREHWENKGKLFNTIQPWWKDDIPEQKGDLWAPDIHYRDGKFHLYYSVSAWMNFNSSIGYATNVTLNPESPDYKWEDHGKVIDFRNGGEGVNCIDPNVFIDDDGRVWLFYGSYKAGLRLVELDRKTGKLKKDPPDITVITNALGEGVFVIKTKDWYYIFASRGKCCAGIESTYQIVMGRSKNIKGPYLNKEGKSWVDNNYSLFLAGDYDEPGRGHNGFFTENDTTFIVYHAYTRSANGASLLNIKPMHIDKDGWPTLDSTQRILFAKSNLFNLKK
jgi:arabinan endo-1,5-alpha-L-arabinosidase